METVTLRNNEENERTITLRDGTDYVDLTLNIKEGKQNISLLKRCKSKETRQPHNWLKRKLQYIVGLAKSYLPTKVNGVL